MSLYQELKDAGVEIDNHYSDLYFKATPEAMEIYRKSEWNGRGSYFKCEIDGAMWFEVAFAYEPYWSTRTLPAEYLRG